MDNNGAALEILIITGLSGAGKSSCVNIFEDMGYYTIDNIPLAIIDKIVYAFYSYGAEATKVAFVIDSRALDSSSKNSFLICDCIRNLKENYSAQVIFMDASLPVIVKRYKESRRPHPLSSNGNLDITSAINLEVSLMSPVKGLADIIIDTDNKNIHELRRELVEKFSSTEEGLSITLQSFGFKYGNPTDSDMMLDVRFLRNPHFDDGLRTMTGLNLEVKEYVRADESYSQFINKAFELLLFLIPLYEKEQKKYLTISIGCTGGKHRSITVLEELAAMLEAKGVKNINKKHRDIDK